MSNLTSKERIARILRREPVDRIGLHESFWPDTRRKWVAEGHLREDEPLEDAFGQDVIQYGGHTMVAWMDYTEEVIEETEETRLVRNANGAVLRWWKHKSGTPEHVDFLVKDRAGWEKYVRPHLLAPDAAERRINLEGYRAAREKAHRQQRFFCWCGINVFECLHPMCGHEHMLIGMVDDPDWVRDMCDVYADLIIRIQQTLFDRVGPPDGIFFFEDMGFKGKPFMSPAMYEQMVWPAHKRTFDFAHDRGLPVIVHSCGYIEPLVPGLIRAGMDCLQAMEVKAGMDLVKLKRQYGDRIAFMGGIDVRVLCANDREAIRAELAAKLPVAMEPSGYVLHSDHSIPDQVEYETYRYFVDLGLRMGTY